MRDEIILALMNLAGFTPDAAEDYATNQPENAQALVSQIKSAKNQMPKNKKIAKRLEELRKELRAERISYGELAELQSLAKYIEPGDVELLEAAGVPEFKEENKSPKFYEFLIAENTSGRMSIRAKDTEEARQKAQRLITNGSAIIEPDYSDMGENQISDIREIKSPDSVQKKNAEENEAQLSDIAAD